MTTYNFPPTSRYYGIEVAATKHPDGRVIAYLRRRFVPPPERFALLSVHRVVEDDRLDLIAHQYLGDSLGFWRVADANAAMRPEALTETPGKVLNITLPEGIPGPNA